MNKRHYSTLKSVINILYFIACVAIFVVVLIVGYMKILHTVTPMNILLFIGFFFLDEVLSIIVWLIGYLLINLFFSERENKNKQNDYNLDGNTADSDISDDDNNVHDAKFNSNDFRL